MRPLFINAVLFKKKCPGEGDHIAFHPWTSVIWTILRLPSRSLACWMIQIDSGS